MDTPTPPHQHTLLPWTSTPSTLRPSSSTMITPNYPTLPLALRCRSIIPTLNLQPTPTFTRQSLHNSLASPLQDLIPHTFFLLLRLLHIPPPLQPLRRLPILPVPRQYLHTPLVLHLHLLPSPRHLPSHLLDQE